MGRKSKFSKEIRIQVCEDYLSGRKGISEISDGLCLDGSTVKRWINSYLEHG